MKPNAIPNYICSAKFYSMPTSPENLLNVTLPENLSTAIPTLIVKRRPDVRSYKPALTIANAKVGITQTAIHSSLTITAAAGITSFRANKWFNIPVNTSQQATRNAGLLFQNAMANYLEVITAQSNILQRELELAVIKRAQLSAGIELYKSLAPAHYLAYRQE